MLDLDGMPAPQGAGDRSFVRCGAEALWRILRMWGIRPVTRAEEENSYGQEQQDRARWPVGQ
jgi:hypothetical protein